MEKKGVEKLIELVNRLDDVVELGEEMLKDGKIDLADIGSLPKAATVLTGLFGAAKEYKEVLAELKDLDKDELKKVIDAAFDG